MKRLLNILLLLAVAATASAQLAVGSWRQYRAYCNVTDQIAADGQVFCLASGNLFAYDPKTSEVQTYDTDTGLNGYGISAMDYDAATHTLVLVYADGLIDLMDTRTAGVTSLTALRDASISNKTVNGISTHDGVAWLLMSFGLVEVNLSGCYFGETYEMERDVMSAAVCDGSIYYCVRNDGIYKASLASNLHGMDAHKRLGGNKYTKLLSQGHYIYGMVATSFDRFDVAGGGFSGKVMGSGKFAGMNMSDGCIVAYGPEQVVIADAEGNPTRIAVANQFKSLTLCDNCFWASCGLDGLQPWKQGDDGVMQQAGSAIIPNSPRYDYFYRMDYMGERLLVAGGAHEYTANPDFDGTASYYDDGTWVNLDTVVIADEKFQNLTGIAQHPDNAALHYVTSMGHGVYVYRDGHLAHRYSCDNSPLQSMHQSSRYYNYVRTNAPTFDDKGNLWVLNCEVDTVVWRLSADGKTWKGYYFEELEGARSPLDICFDGSDRMWVLSRDMGVRGVFCYDMGSRKHKLNSRILQQDGLEYTPDNFLCMTPDKDGAIWVGTEQGLFVIDKPDTFFDTDFEWTQIKVNRNDGSGLADYLLSGAYVSAIAVDGGNRKWIGTLGSGVYLLSPDGQETIHHFTADNSPLPSDVVRSIAVNPATGEVMIGTTDGLASYMSDATEPEERLEKGNIVIYPNPVSPDYEGDVIIRGLAADCEVKIAGVGGQVLWSDTSVGGTCTWNLQRKNGGRVSSGVYNVIINTADASNVIVGRLAVIR